MKPPILNHATVYYFELNFNKKWFVQLGEKKSTMVGSSRVMAIMRCIRLEPNRSMTVDEFKAWLRTYDDNHDGRISQEEFKEALHGLRIWFGRWKAKKAMESVDSNHSGTIDSVTEMEKLVKYAQKHLHIKIYES
ncbi:hypothetical protein E3N88_30145 [Mikania micrantha]|uniref:EF-hand domain-containing protein n=1 Tax=Mikania micrantha TaxID=192012 RepID=A0A5N6MLJ2_9ASTR|nr:hypothetical protein E3N88_30145 [Mikania micrantha]